MPYLLKSFLPQIQGPDPTLSLIPSFPAEKKLCMGVDLSFDPPCLSYLEPFSLSLSLSVGPWVESRGLTFRILGFGIIPDKNFGANTVSGSGIFRKMFLFLLFFDIR